MAPAIKPGDQIDNGSVSFTVCWPIDMKTSQQ